MKALVHGGDGRAKERGVSQGKRHRFNDPCGTFNPLLNEQQLQTQKLGVVAAQCIAALLARLLKGWCWLAGAGQTLARCNIPNHTHLKTSSAAAIAMARTTTYWFRTCQRKYKYPLSPQIAPHSVWEMYSCTPRCAIGEAVTELPGENGTKCIGWAYFGNWYQKASNTAWSRTSYSWNFYTTVHLKSYNHLWCKLRADFETVLPKN